MEKIITQEITIKRLEKIAENRVEVIFDTPLGEYAVTTLPAPKWVIYEGKKYTATFELNEKEKHYVLKEFNTPGVSGLVEEKFEEKYPILF